MQFKAVLEELGKWFDDHGFPFAVIGGLALHAYGISRLTYDLDLITVGEAQGEVVSFLEYLGYETLHRSLGFSNHQHTEPARGRIDVLYVRSDTADQLFGEAETRTLLSDMKVQVPRPEHLIALKLHAMQNEPDRLLHDLADIHSLMRLPNVEQDTVRQLFAEKGQTQLYEKLQEEG